MLPEAELTSFIAAQFSMMNPIGNLGVFAGMTSDRPDAEARMGVVTRVMGLILARWAC